MASFILLLYRVGEKTITAVWIWKLSPRWHRHQGGERRLLLSIGVKSPGFALILLMWVDGKEAPLLCGHGKPGAIGTMTRVRKEWRVLPGPRRDESPGPHSAFFDTTWPRGVTYILSAQQWRTVNFSFSFWCAVESGVSGFSCVFSQGEAVIVCKFSVLLGCPFPQHFTEKGAFTGAFSLAIFDIDGLSSSWAQVWDGYSQKKSPETHPWDIPWVSRSLAALQALFPFLFCLFYNLHGFSCTYKEQ